PTPRGSHSISPTAPSHLHPVRRFAPAPPPPDAPGPPRERPRPRAGPRRACGPPQSPAVVTARLVLVPRAAPPRARPGAAHPPGPPRSARPGPPSGSATRRGRGRRRRAGRDREGGRGSFARLRPAHRPGRRPAGLLAGAEYLLRQGAVLLHIRDHDVAREDAAGALRGALRHRQAVAAAHQEVGHRHRVRARRAGGLAGVPGAALRLAEHPAAVVDHPHHDRSVRSSLWIGAGAELLPVDRVPQARYAHRRLAVMEHRFQRVADVARPQREDRKSTRLNSSHVAISYAVFCLKKKKNYTMHHYFVYISHEYAKLTTLKPIHLRKTHIILILNNKTSMLYHSMHEITAI